MFDISHNFQIVGTDFVEKKKHKRWCFVSVLAEFKYLTAVFWQHSKNYKFIDEFNTRCLCQRNSNSLHCYINKISCCAEVVIALKVVKLEKHCIFDSFCKLINGKMLTALTLEIWPLSLILSFVSNSFERLTEPVKVYLIIVY